MSAMSWLVATFPDEAQQEVFESKDPRISGVFSPTEAAAVACLAQVYRASLEALGGQVTYRQGIEAPSQQGDVGDPGGESAGGPTNMAERASGYGSEHGLSPEDRAYRMDVHPPAGREDGAGDETRIGGDERSDHEERF